MKIHQCGAVSRGFLVTVLLLVVVVGGAVIYMRSNAYLPPEMQAMMEQTEHGMAEAMMEDIKHRQRAYIEELRPLAEQGDVSAQRKLAGFLRMQDDEASLSESFAWMSKAAESGSVSAQYELGFYYECGIGTIKDLTQAIRSYTAAAERGDVMAMNALSEIETDKVKAQFWSDKVTKAMEECKACDLPSGGCG